MSTGLGWVRLFQRFVLPVCAIAVLGIPPRQSASAAQKKRPNILFIYTDDHSHRTVSCYPEAYKWVRTPNIDRLAEKGVRFAHAYIGTWCMPSRATLLTGHLPFGVESMRMVGQYPGSTYDPAKCPFWPKEFRKQGYVTAHIGKWHTGTDTGNRRDWDYQIVWNRPKYPNNSAKYYYDQLVTFNDGETKRVEGYSTDNYTRWAVDFLNGTGRDADKPWYLWLCYGAVHGPFTPADRHLDAYPDVPVPTPVDIFPPRPGKPAYMQEIEHWVRGPGGKPVLKGRRGGIHGDTLTDWTRQYHQGVLAIDEAVGKLMQTLEETDQAENTLVVFTSDQGFAWGQHGFRSKLAPYDATIRSPLIVSMPGRLPEGVVCEHPAGGADLIPTFFRFAGIDLPWKMHGHDLTPLLQNPKAEWPHPLLLTATGRKYGSDTTEIPTGPDVYHGGIPWWAFLREGRFKYIRYMVEGEIEELYDLSNDPEELTNLALESKYASKLAEMRDETVAQLRRTNAGFVENLPAVQGVTR